MREAYKHFVGAIVELIDKEVPSEEFHEVALTSYRLFSRLRDEDDIDRIVTEKK